MRLNIYFLRLLTAQISSGQGNARVVAMIRPLVNESCFFDLATTLFIS